MRQSQGRYSGWASNILGPEIWIIYTSTGSSYTWAYDFISWVPGKGLKVALQGEKMQCKQALEIASLQRITNFPSIMVQMGHFPCWEGHLWGQLCYLSYREHTWQEAQCLCPALCHGSPRGGPKEGALINNLHELEVPGKRRLSRHVVAPAPMYAGQSGEKPAHCKHLGHTSPEVIAVGASSPIIRHGSGIKTNQWD